MEQRKKKKHRETKGAGLLSEGMYFRDQALIWVLYKKGLGEKRFYIRKGEYCRDFTIII